MKNFGGIMGVIEPDKTLGMGKAIINNIEFDIFYVNSPKTSRRETKKSFFKEAPDKSLPNKLDIKLKQFIETKKFEDFFFENKFFISKKTNLRSHHSKDIKRNYEIELYDSNLKKLNGTTLFEFKSIWVIEQFFFKLLFDAINILNNNDVNEAKKFFKKEIIISDGLECVVPASFDIIRNDEMYKKAEAELYSLKKIRFDLLGYYEKDNRYFLLQNDFFYDLYKNNEDFDNKKLFIKKIKRNISSDDEIFNILKKFILQKINFLINLSVNSELNINEKGEINDNKVLNGLRGIFTFLCINTIKTGKGSLKCKNCNNYISITLGSGRRDKLFCSTKCKSEWFYKRKKTEINFIQNFHGYGYDLIIPTTKHFDAIIYPEMIYHLRSKLMMPILFCEITYNDKNISINSHLPKIIQKLSILNDKDVKTMIDIQRPNVIKEKYNIKICFLYISKEVNNFERYTYFLKNNNDKWGVFELNEILNCRDLLRMFNKKPEKIVSTNLILEN